MKDPSSKGPFIIREAVPDDLAALVQIHVTSWNATYPTAHPKPSPALREQQWKKAFSTREHNWFCYVVENKDKEMVGFATGDDFTSDDLPFDAHLNKIHFLKEYHRLGLGTQLVGHVVRRFVAEGKTSMILFSDPDNPNIRFYDTLGGERILDKQGVFHGAFGWYNLQRLAELCAST